MSSPSCYFFRFLLLGEATTIVASPVIAAGPVIAVAPVLVVAPVIAVAIACYSFYYELDVTLLFLNSIVDFENILSIYVAVVIYILWRDVSWCRCCLDVIIDRKYVLSVN